MMKWARLENGFVRETIDFDPVDKFHSDLIWALCPDNVKEGYVYNGVDFQPPPAEPLTEVKKRKLVAIRDQASRLIEAKWPLWRQLNADAGIYPVEVKNQKNKDIVAVIMASNEAEDRVDIATSSIEVEAVQPVFPVI
jgi:hypothetical protein